MRCTCALWPIFSLSDEQVTGIDLDPAPLLRVTHYPRFHLNIPTGFVFCFVLFLFISLVYFPWGSNLEVSGKAIAMTVKVIFPDSPDNRKADLLVE